MKNTLWLILIFIVLQLLPVSARPEDGTPDNSRGTSSAEARLKVISIQVASFKDFKPSEQELIRLESRGLKPFMHHESVPGKGMRYRIFVGRFEEMEKATKFAQELKNQGIIPGFWIKRIGIPFDPAIPAPTAIEKTDKPALEIDAEHEAQASPSEMMEMPAAVILPQKEPAIPPTSIEVPKDKPSPSATQAEMHKATLSEKDQEAALTKKTELKETSPLNDGQEDSLPLTTQSADKDKEAGKFSLGARSSFFLAPKTEDFLITRSSGADSQTWSFQEAITYFSVISSYRLNSAFLFEAGIERAFFSSLDLWHLSVGPKVEFGKIGLLTPYAKGSLVVGRLEWDEAPGDFDLASGWECGFGTSFTKSKVQIGFEASYRAITYNYNLPSEAGVTATDSQLDFSGYALSATLTYWF